MYTHTRARVYIHTHMHLCWVVPCSITDVVAAYDLAILLDSDTGLLHTTFEKTMFIFTIHIIPMSYVSVTAMHVVLSLSSLGPIGRIYIYIYTSCTTSFLMNMLSRYRYVVLKTVASWEIIGSAFCRKGLSP